jgi:hypothetical protein
LRSAVAALSGERVLHLLLDALAELPEATRRGLVEAHVGPVSRSGPGGGDDVLVDVTAFQIATLAGEYYKAVAPSDAEATTMPARTKAWAAQCRGLFDRLVASARVADPVRVGAAFEVMFDLLRRIDAGQQVLFFWGDGGSWQVGVEWERVFPAWFHCLSRTTTPEECARRIAEAVDRLNESDRPMPPSRDARFPRT